MALAFKILTDDSVKDEDITLLTFQAQILAESLLRVINIMVPCMVGKLSIEIVVR